MVRDEQVWKMLAIVSTSNSAVGASGMDSWDSMSSSSTSGSDTNFSFDLCPGAGCKTGQLQQAADE